MTLTEIIQIANDAYPDAFLGEYFDFDKGERIPGGFGDSLAMFIVNEIVETYEPNLSDAEQLGEASRVIECGRDDLQGVLHALERAQGEAEEPDPV